MDIGGSLTKIAYYSILPLKKIVYDDHETVDDDAVYEVTEGARLHFMKFETKHIEATLDYIQKSLLGAKTDMTVMDVKVTGGGAYKYSEMIERKLGLKITKEDEMLCMIRGCNFLLRNITDEAFSYQRKVELKTRLREVLSFTIIEEAHTRAFSWLKAFLLLSDLRQY